LLRLFNVMPRDFIEEARRHTRTMKTRKQVKRLASPSSTRGQADGRL